MAVSLEEKVRFLTSPDAYRQVIGDVGRIETIETHMSWIFLLGDRVFKMKKPVLLPFLDLSTLQDRKTNCRAELQLNRRLAPHIYLGVVALTVGPLGELTLGGDGEPIDWLVEMRRLPEERMLNNLIARNQLTEHDIERLATFLADFYRRTDHPDIDPRIYFDNLMLQHKRNHDTLLNPRVMVDKPLTTRVLTGIEHAIRSVQPMIEDRIRTKRFVEGHGDLRPDHICLVDPIVVFDCLEFDRNYRLMDPFDELSFLDVECIALGAPWFGVQLLGRVERRLGENISVEMLRFYAGFRAAMRARLMLGHLLDDQVRNKSGWRKRAKAYLAIADNLLFRDGYFHPHSTTASDEELLGTYSSHEEAS